MQSNEYTRSELVGMIAALRGELYNVVQNYKHRNKPTGSEEELKESIEEADRMLVMTSFDLSKSDERNGGFDNSWKDHEFLSGFKKLKND